MFTKKVCLYDSDFYNLYLTFMYPSLWKEEGYHTVIAESDENSNRMWEKCQNDYSYGDNLISEQLT